MARRKKLIPDEDTKATAPIEEDIRSDDLEYDPQAVEAIEPKSSKAWLNLLQESEDAFDDWNIHCDKIDKRYANLERLSRMGRDKEFQMFWANCEVIKPSIYAKPPQPVVAPKFKDRRPVYQAASEVAERCAIVSFDLAGIDELMKLIRDDLALADRGVAWCRYESGKGGGFYTHEKVCIDFKNRRDFLHSISRNWREVTWVAAASYLTRGEARKRFVRHSGKAYQDAEYRVDKEAKEIGGADNRERAKFWEIWDKAGQRCIWVSPGCERVLDDADPHLELREFFPCPKPAYGTVQRGSLVPVPDVLQYEDQLDELNLLTGRIHALSDALEVKGFYPAGGGELADAVQTAVRLKTPGRILVPISNWAAFGGSKEIIVWLPIDQIAQTIIQLVTLRKQVIEDIYQIMGLSDIMRGATDPNETLGTQQLKTQYGSTRIRDKQQELVRLARDLVEISLQIITKEFDPVTIIEMSQTQLPTKQMVERQIQQLQQGLMQGQQLLQQAQQQASSAPNQQQPGQPQANPQTEQIQKMMEQGQAELQKLQEKPTIDQVLHFLTDNRAKAFVLDIETDSTIQADEQMEKQQTNEFVQVLGGLLPQLGQMIAADPSTATFCGELIKFATKPYRAGRQLDGAIDELVEQLKAKGAAPRGDDPTTALSKTQLQIEQMKQQTAKQKNDQDAALKKMELDQKDKHKTWELNNAKAIERMKLEAKNEDADGKMAVQQQKAMTDREKHQMDMLKKQTEVAAAREKAQMAATQMAAQHEAKQADFANRASERQMLSAQKAQGGIV